MQLTGPRTPYGKLVANKLVKEVSDAKIYVKVHCDFDCIAAHTVCKAFVPRQGGEHGQPISSVTVKMPEDPAAANSYRRGAWLCVSWLYTW